MSTDTDTTQQQQQIPVGMFQDEVEALNGARKDILNKIQAASGEKMMPSVANGSRIMFENFDTAYLWLLQVEQMLIMNSPENVDKVAEEAMASGNVIKMPDVDASPEK